MGKLFQSRHALSKTEFMPQKVNFAAGNLSKGPFRMLYVMFLKTKYGYIDCLTLTGATFTPANHGNLLPKNSFVLLVQRKKYLCLI